MEQEQMFQLPENVKQRESIVVFGVGGGGGNALNHIINSGVEGVEFVAANTDAKALSMNKARNKIVLGERLTRGLGAGANPQVGMDAAKESMDRIKEFIEGADMLFVTAGMGGGTGTGAAPIIAEAAMDMGVLVVGVVTMPFSFEMQKRLATAEEGVARLRDKVDALLVVENDRLLALADERMRLVDAYKMVDEVLRQAVQGVTDLIIKPGVINLDFADIKTVMQDSGSAIMGIGVGEGDSRAELAAKAAIKSPLMSVPMQGAKGVLLNFTTGPDVGLLEVSKAAEVIKSMADPDANVIWGHVIDEEVGESIRLTLIATGFPSENAALAPGKALPQSRASKTDSTTSVAKTLASLYSPTARKPSASGFEETRLQAPGEDEPDPFRGVPSTVYDSPSIYRRRSQRLTETD
ncbi:MAG: cell division protein FtsZ [Fretibacterium sp.]|nr:cell division protein FtsZ [Fretibacterium sp.]